MNTREEWLNKALKLCSTWLQLTANVECPAITRVSCGFPGGGSARKRIGECWPDSASADAATEIFISPVLADSNQVLATLLHEAVHAAIGCKHGHKGPFKRVAVLAGLEGKMTATTASVKLIETVFPGWMIELGAYPHAQLSLLGRKKQSTRLIKCTCPACGYVVRTTQKWIDKGAPYCATCEDEDSGDKIQMTSSIEETEEDAS